MATSNDKFSTGYKGGRKKRGEGQEVAGPYRDQSSNPKIRSEATPREHRKVRVKVPAPTNPFKVEGPHTPKNPRTDSPQLQSFKERYAEDHESGLSPGDILSAVETGLGLKKDSATEVGGRTVRHLAEDEAKSLAETLKKAAEKTYSPKGVGGQKSYENPTKAEAAALATGLSAIPAAEGAGAGEKALQKTISQASDASSAAKAGSKIVAKVKGAPKAAVKSARDYPVKKVAQAKSVPKKIKAAPKAAKQAATTPEGRRAAAKGAGKTAAKHPVRSSYLGAVALPEGVLPGDVTKRARAFAEGSANAILHHPAETLETTARALPAAITGPVALGASAVESAIHGTPAPLVNTAKEQAEGVGHIIGTAFSGDPRKAEEAARKEGSLSLLTPLPALSRTPVGRFARDEARTASSAIRRGLATTDKLPAKEFRNRRIRHAPKGHEEGATALSERHFTRTRISKAWQRIHNKHSVPADRHAGKILNDLANAPKGSHIALQTLAEYGIRNEKGADLIRKQGPQDAQLIAALDYARLHPEIFKDKHFLAALKHSEEAVNGHPAASAQVGERARVLPQGDALGITRPEHMVPFHKRDEFGATSWADAVERLKDLRKRQRKALDAAPPWGRSVIEADLVRTQDMLKEAKKGAKRKANVRAKKRIVTLEDGTKRKVSVKEAPYGKKELKEYVEKVEAARKEAGLAKAIWTHHSKADSEKGVDLNLGPTAARKEYAREGRLAKEDNLDRSLEGLIRGTVQRPRYNAANKEFLQHIAENERIQGLTIDGKPFELGNGSADWKKLTSRKTKDNPDGGQIDPNSMTRFPLRQWENAIDDPFKTDAQRSDAMLNILKAARDNRINGNEPWIPVRREALKEAEGQIHANHNEFVKFINAGNRVASRTLLATNPAWLIAQTVAEGVPMVVAHPSLLEPAHLGNFIHRLVKERRENPEQAMAVQATAGAAPTNGRYLSTPIDKEGVMTPEIWNRSAQAMTRGKSLKAVLSFAKLRTLPELDIHRQNLYRELIYRAQADKKFRKWYSGLTGMFDGAAEISKQFKGKSDRELQEWLLSDDPKARYWNKKMAEHVDDVAGNWGAFTRFEKSAAPFLIFYPFLRYSIRWVLWSFPKSHPIRATALALLGQANANQLEKLVGHPLENPAQYAEPIYTNAEGKKSTLPGGTRISPGQSSLTQALASNNPSAIAQSLNPEIGIAAKGVFGIDTFTGEPIHGSRGEAIANELLALPAPLRLLGLKLGGESPGAKAFAQYNKDKALRSVGFPFLPQSEDEFKGEQELSKQFATKYGEGHIPGPFDSKLVQELLYGNNGNPKPEMLPEVLNKIHEAESASATVKQAEAPFLPPSGGFTEQQKELLEAVENAWKTGPNAQPQEAEGGRFEQAAKKFSGGATGKYAEVAENLGGNYSGRFAEAAGKSGG